LRKMASRKQEHEPTQLPGVTPNFLPTSSSLWVTATASWLCWLQSIHPSSCLVSPQAPPDSLPLSGPSSMALTCPMSHCGLSEGSKATHLTVSTQSLHQNFSHYSPWHVCDIFPAGPFSQSEPKETFLQVKKQYLQL
jgi:hypothetical protein